MNTSQLTEKEINILEQLARNQKISQRTIARNTGLSLGLVNLIIKKLAKTGYVKIKQLNRKKIEYILTPKGFAEKTKKTYNYILKTTNQFLTIYSKLNNLIAESIKNGKTNFYIFADDEIYNLLMLIFNTLNNKNIKHTRIYKLPQNFNGSLNVLYLITDETMKFKNSSNIVNLIQYIS